MILRRPSPEGELADQERPYRILSLSGGGYRGLFTAQMLACIGARATQPFAGIEKSVMLTTVSWIAGRLVLLRSGALADGSSPAQCSILDATCASAAAPAHFPARKIMDDWYVDGGLVANCPDLHALHAAAQPGRTVMMLSVGTAGVTQDSSPDRLPHRGLMWARPALDLGIHAQELLAQEACARQLQDRYLHLNKRPGVGQGELRDLDLANPTTTGMLKTLANVRFDELTGDAAQMNALKRIVSSTPILR